MAASVLMESTRMLPVLCATAISREERRRANTSEVHRRVRTWILTLLNLDHLALLRRVRPRVGSGHSNRPRSYPFAMRLRASPIPNPSAEPRPVRAPSSVHPALFLLGDRFVILDAPLDTAACGESRRAARSRGGVPDALVRARCSDPTSFLAASTRRSRWSNCSGGRRRPGLTRHQLTIRNEFRRIVDGRPRPPCRPPLGRRGLRRGGSTMSCGSCVS